MKNFEINVLEQIGTGMAVSSDDGDSLYKLIIKALEQNMNVILDFSNIDIMTSTFLNAAIGQLYSKFDGEYLKKHLKVKKIDRSDALLLKKVIERAKEYFKDKNKQQKLLEDVIKDEDQ